MQGNTAAVSEGVVFAVASLWERLVGMSDQRRARGKRYPLPPLLLLMVLAKLSGEDRPSGIAEGVALRSGPLPAALDLVWPRMPPHHTSRRVLSGAVDAEALAAPIGAFFRDLPGAGQSVLISIDGKTLRGTIDGPATRGEHRLAAYLPAAGFVLLQVAVGGKENEISVAPTLLRALDVRGKVVIGDALHTQRAVSAQIVPAGGDEVWFVKDNQPTLRAEIEQLFMADDRTVAGGHLPPELRMAHTVDKGHGRQDTRTLWASSDLRDYGAWPGLPQVFRLERARHQTKRDKRAQEVVYGVTSLAPAAASAARLLALTRAYWGIENGLHYRRDVTFHADATRLTQGQAGRVMATLNNLVIGLLSRAGYTNHAAARSHGNADLSLALTLLTPAPCT